MISSVTFHPFISHFSPALFVAGLALLFLAHKKNDEKLKAAGAFNLSLGLLASVVADFSGMISVDINLRTVVEVEGHQGYSFLFTILYGFSADRKSTRLNSSHKPISYAVFCLKKKKIKQSEYNNSYNE